MKLIEDVLNNVEHLREGRRLFIEVLEIEYFH